MGQIVDGRPVRDLTYNTRFGWLKLRRHSKNHAPPKARLRKASAPPGAKLAAKLHRANAGNIEAAKRLKGNAARAEGRAIAKDGEARTVGAKVAEAIVLTTGVAIADALKARLKSTSRS
jgi:hypothetical protein